MSHVFISYSRSNIDYADKIVQALAENDMDIWVDWKSIPSGEKWKQEIFQGIEDAYAFLFLISPESVISEMCKAEISHAIRNGKRVVTLLIRDTDIDSIPEEVSDIQWIKCRDGKDSFKEAIKEIRDTVKTDYGWLKYHGWLQVKALEWERTNDTSRLLRGKELQEAEDQFAGVGSEKDPQPTDLQRQYLLNSRRNEERIRRRNAFVLIGSLIIAIIFSIIALIQRNNASIQRNLALARRLSNHAKEYCDLPSDDMKMLCMLLSTESIERYHTSDAYLNLQTAKINLPNYLYVYGNDNAIRDYSFSPDGRYFATVDKDGAARVIEISSGDEVALMQHDEPVWVIAYRPDGRYFATWSPDGTTRVVEVSSGDEVVLMQHDEPVWVIAYSPDGRYLATGSTDGTTRIVEVSSGDEVARVQNDIGVSAIAFSTDGSYIANWSEDGTLLVVEVSSGDEVARVRNEGFVREVAFSPDGRYFATVDKDGTAHVVEVNSGDEAVSVQNDMGVSAIAFSPDGRYFATASIDGTARVIEISSGDEVVRARNIGFIFVREIVFSLDGRYIATGSTDGTARVIEISSGDEVAQVQNDGAVLAITFSPDGRYFATGSMDGTARVIKVSNGDEVARVRNEGFVREVAFSPDGRYIATGSNDGTARVIDVSSGDEVLTMPHKGIIRAIAFSPEGRYFATGSMDGKIQILFYRYEDIVTESCKIIQRNLSLDEWYQFVGEEIPYNITCIGKYIPRDAQNELNRIQARQIFLAALMLDGIAILVLRYVVLRR